MIRQLHSNIQHVSEDISHCKSCLLFMCKNDYLTFCVLHIFEMHLGFTAQKLPEEFINNIVKSLLTCALDPLPRASAFLMKAWR